MPDPLAFFLTWATYGTWSPGDERGWVKYQRGWRLPDPVSKLEAKARMNEDACILSPDHRRVVEETIEKHCQIRGWVLHAVNCRTNHLHVVVSANLSPEKVRLQLKAWSTRRLKEFEKRLRPVAEGPITARENWWAERGSSRYINDEESLEAAIQYVRNWQDRPKQY